MAKATLPKSNEGMRNSNDRVMNVSQSETDFESALAHYAEVSQGMRDVGNKGKLKEWTLYTAAAGSALTAAQSADASIVYSGVQNIMVVRTQTSQYATIDINNDGIDDFQIGIYANTNSQTV